VIYGLEIARAFGAAPILIHVVADGLTRVFGDGVLVSNAELQAEREISARGRLDLLVNSEDRDLLKAQTVVIAPPEPAYAIALYARDSDVDLIGMGTHGRGGLAHFLIGSVAERVVRFAPCPVLTVRHPEHEFVLPDAPAPITQDRR